MVQIDTIQFNLHAGGTYRLFYSIPTLVVQIAAIQLNPHVDGASLLYPTLMVHLHAGGIDATD